MTYTLPVSQRWRTGRKVKRTIYVQTGPKPSDEDMLVGVMDTPELARIVVDAVNTCGLRQGFAAFGQPTRRELEVLKLVADGCANGEIARRLFITERTVKFHLSGLLQKLMARDRAHLVALAFRAGLLTS